MKTKVDTENLGESLSQLRKERGFSQNDITLLGRLGTSEANGIYRFERLDKGDLRGFLKALPGLARCLGPEIWEIGFWTWVRFRKDCALGLRADSLPVEEKEAEVLSQVAQAILLLLREGTFPRGRFISQDGRSLPSYEVQFPTLEAIAKKCKKKLPSEPVLRHLLEKTRLPQLWVEYIPLEWMSPLWTEQIEK